MIAVTENMNRVEGEREKERDVVSLFLLTLLSALAGARPELFLSSTIVMSYLLLHVHSKFIY